MPATLGPCPPAGHGNNAAPPRRHECPGAEPEPARELARRVLAEPWLASALDAVAASGLPDAWIGAGVIRDVVWGQLHDGFDPALVRDVDVVFFDPGDLSPARDGAAQRRLGELAGRPWEASNQAAVHTWFHDYFGGPPRPAFASVHEAVATWPETATCVAVRRAQGQGDSAPGGPAGGGLEVCAPHGLADLLGGTWRRNPVRVSLATSRERLARQRIAARWPGVTIIPPE
ncbi:MAG: nucleotidyltransferase family protein [Streptosporangiaceae bacterium]